MSVADKAKTATRVVQAFLWALFALVIIAFLISQSARKHVATMAREANIKSVGEKGFEFFEEKSRQLVEENTELKMKQNAVPSSQDVKPG